jgi:hypothetical protein
VVLAIYLCEFRGMGCDFFGDGLLAACQSSSL